MIEDRLRVSVILCTRNPDSARLARTLEGLSRQTLAGDAFDILLIDNGSTPPLAARDLPVAPRTMLRILREDTPGLTPARLRGITEALGDVLVFVDDDNVLDADFLRSAAEAFQESPRLGAAGGPVRPEFSAPPPEWLAEFHGLLALHDHGPTARVAPGGTGAPWPAFSPVGAGLCVRRSAALAYRAAVLDNPERAGLDRSAGSLKSGGDNDLVFTVLHAGGDVAYLPQLSLTHLIPADRLSSGYLARLNRGIQRSWVTVLTLHGQCPWRTFPRWTLAPRMGRAWLRYRPWTDDPSRIRYAGIVGRLEGLADAGSA